MKCDELRPILEAFLDGETDAPRAVEMERHMEHCPACLAARDQLLSLRTAIRAGAAYHRAPAVLLQKLTALSPSQSAAESAPPPPRRIFPWRAAAIAAALLLMTTLAFITFTRASATSPDQLLAAEVLSAHLRSLQAGHLSDVASSDQHTVRPWFAGKLDFAPPVTDLKEQGFTLLGGRLDYLAGHPVAALIYQRKAHIINVFLWPASSPSAEPQTQTLRGYHLLHSTRDGIQFYLVSDMDEGGLEDLEKLLPTKP